MRGLVLALLVLLALCVPQYAVGVLASRRAFVEDQVH